jgi:hypothetical protein
VEDALKELMQRLGNAVNKSLSDSEEIAAAIEEIKEAGYEVKLRMEVTVGSKGEGRDEAVLELEPREE